MAKKASMPPASGGDWVVECVFRTQDGTTVEGSRFQLVWAHSYVAQVADASEPNMGFLLRGRMREVLRKVRIRW